MGGGGAWGCHTIYDPGGTSTRTAGSVPELTPLVTPLCLGFLWGKKPFRSGLGWNFFPASSRCGLLCPRKSRTPREGRTARVPSPLLPRWHRVGRKRDSIHDRGPGEGPRCVSNSLQKPSHCSSCLHRVLHRVLLPRGEQGPGKHPAAPGCSQTSVEPPACNRHTTAEPPARPTRLSGGNRLQS